MADHNDLGVIGELKAQRFLLQNAYKILDVNWQYGHKEIDIVAQNNQTLHVIEVKTRRQDYVERPQDAISLKKQQLIIDAANAYVIKNNLPFPVQFDIISIVLNPNFEKFEYIEGAFYPKVRSR
jgi:putative endonuclease